MLAQMRKGAGSWVAKILMLLLVVSFGAWGIGDYVRTSNLTPPVAKIGKQEISALEFSDAMRREGQQLSRRIGQPLNREQMLQFGLDESVLAGLIAAKAYEQAAIQQGLTATAGVVRDYIMRADTFKGTNGQFDRLRYDAFLRNEGYSESMLVELVRRDLLREQLLGSLLSGVETMPTLAVDTILAFRLETRVADYIRIEAAKLPAPAAPSEAEIEEYYKANPARFSNPERRDISFVSFTPATRAGEIAVSDEEIKEEYEAHKADYVTPERRLVQQVVFNTEDEAKTARAAVLAGEDFIAMAARTRQLKPADAELGLLQKEQLPADLSGPAFALAQAGLTEPVKSAFGWHLLRVVEIKAGSVTPLAEVNDKLKQQVALQKAGDALLKLRPQVEDLIAGGAPLDEIAKVQKAKLTAVAGLDARGQDATGKAVEGLPTTQPAFLPEAFQLAEKVDPVILDQADGGFQLLQVMAIKPAAVKPLEEVRGDVVAALTAIKRSKAADQVAMQIAERLRAGGDLLKEAQALGVVAQTTPPLSRGGQPADKALSPSVVSLLFAAKQPGEVAVGPASTSGDAIVARLGRIVPADVAAVAAQRDRASQQLTQGLIGELEERYRKQVEANLGLSVNTAAKARAF